MVIEALCTGTPVVATRFAAIPEMFEDGEAGFLVDEGDVPFTAERVGELLTRPDLRREMGWAARARYEEAFTVALFACRLADAFNAAASDA